MKKKVSTRAASAKSGDGGPKKKLTVKDRKFIKAVTEHGNKTRAAREAGFKSKTYDGLRVVGSQKAKELQVPIRELMEKKGLGDSQLLDKLKEGLDAKLVKTASYQGRIMDEKSYVDYEVRHRYLDLAFDLNGAKAPVKLKADVTEHEELVPEEKELLNTIKEELLKGSRMKKKK